LLLLQFSIVLLISSMSSAEDDYLEYRKQDPEFQRMVEEEMRKLTQELGELGQAEPESFYAPTANHSEKKQILHSPEKSYGISGIRGHSHVDPVSARKAERDAYLHSLTSQAGEDTFASRQGDAQSAKREKQEAYAQQLRKQEQDNKQLSSMDNGRVALHRQKMRPTSPIVVQKSSNLSSIGNYELGRCSPDAKRKQQQLYAQQLLEGQQAAVIPTTRVLRNKPQSQAEDSVTGYRMPSDALDPMLHSARSGRSQGPDSASQSRVLGSVSGVQLHEGMGDGVGLPVGSSATDDQRAVERRRKQAEYSRQLDTQRTVDYEVAVKKYQEIVEPPSPLSKQYEQKLQEYKAGQRAGNVGTGLDVGNHAPSSGRRSGRAVDPEEERERREKIERQRKYAEELKAGASLMPVENPRKVSGRPRPREQLPQETNMFGGREEAEKANKRQQQQQYFKQLQDAANQVCG
jgi:hypothetical protein